MLWKLTRNGKVSRLVLPWLFHVLWLKKTMSFTTGSYAIDFWRGTKTMATDSNYWGGVYEAPLSDSLRRGDPCPTLRFLFHSPCIWEKSCTPKKGTLFKMFLYGYIYILWNFQNNRFPYDFLKVVSVRHLSSTFSSLVSSHPQLHLILLTFLVFIKFFTDKEKRYFSFSFFTFILCLARLLKVLSELKVF